MRRIGKAMAVVMALGVAAAPAAARPARPDLKVTKGSVHAARGKLSGSFVVRNGGTARSGRFAAALSVRNNGKFRRLSRFHLRSLDAGHERTIDVDGVKSPKGLSSGTHPLRVCADSGSVVVERREGNNCRQVGTFKVKKAATSPPHKPTSAPPSDPIPFSADTVFSRTYAVNGGTNNYWAYVPSSYDPSNQKPTTLFVWMHGCGGEGSGDIYTISPGGAGQHYIAISLGGREDACWDVNNDEPLVLGAIADVKTHFNIDPHRVVIGGYSSGGDLSYRTAFEHSKLFAGLLAENTAPFRDTGRTQAQLLAAAKSKFHVVHLAHLQDETYGIDEVRKETDALQAAGFPVQRIERPGTHYDDSTATSGTDHDLQTYLLPHLNDAWYSP